MNSKKLKKEITELEDKKQLLLKEIKLLENDVSDLKDEIKKEIVTSLQSENNKHNIMYG